MMNLFSSSSLILLMTVKSLAVDLKEQNPFLLITDLRDFADDIKEANGSILRL